MPRVEAADRALLGTADRNAAWLGGAFVIVLLTQQLRVPGTSVPVASVATGVVLVVLVLRGARFKSLTAVLLCVILATYATAVTLLGAIRATNSGAVEVLISIPFVWSVVAFAPILDMTGVSQERLRAIVKYTLLFVCGLGYVQFFVQIYGGGYVGLREVVPTDWLLPGYVNTSGFGSSGMLPGLLRGNGMVFLEPSYAGQFYALGALLFLSAGSIWSIPMVAMVLLTGSGTGFLVLAAGVLVGLFAYNRRSWLILIAIAASSYFALAGLRLGDAMFDRTSELSNSESSGSIRFVAPYQHLSQFWGDFDVHAIFGLGSGGSGFYAGLADTKANYSFLPSAIIDFGVVGVILAAVILYRICRLEIDLGSRVGLVLIVLVMSGGFSTPMISATVLVLVAGLSPDCVFDRLGGPGMERGHRPFYGAAGRTDVRREPAARLAWRH